MSYDEIMNTPPKPEDYFSMVTVMPKKKIKVVAYLEDEDGDRVTIADIAENLVEFITSHMTNEESTDINSQIMPLCGSFITSIIPRFVGFRPASFMFSASIFKDALLYLSMSSVLFIQYIEQNKLKIVTETFALSQEEIDIFLKKGAESEAKLQDIFGIMNGDTDVE